MAENPIVLRRYDSPVGAMTLAADGEALVGAWFDGQKHFGSTIAGLCTVCGSSPVLEDACRWLDRYFAGGNPAMTLPLKLRGSGFQLAVWRHLQTIARGTTVTYADVARELGSSPRAVGSAVGRNPLLIFVPCHRVVGVGGRLTGYAAGESVKLRLLQLEK